MLVPHISELSVRNPCEAVVNDICLPQVSFAARSRSRQLGVGAEFGMERFRV